MMPSRSCSISICWRAFGALGMKAERSAAKRVWLITITLAANATSHNNRGEERRFMAVA